jgi:hypothetical protein
MNFENTKICWEEFKKSIRYINTDTGYSEVFKLGDTITFKGRPANDPRVIITEFTGEDPNGPMGMVYLPWRIEKQCWATPLLTLRGNPRHIICYPVGNLHYGQHIDWTTVKHLSPLDHPNYILPNFE